MDFPEFATKEPKLYGRNKMKIKVGYHDWFPTLTIFCILCNLVICYTAIAQIEPQIGQHSYTFKGTKQQLDYLLFLPSWYNEEPSRELPLILYLHGAGVNDGNVNNIKEEGLPLKVESNQDFPFIVISPHFPSVIANPILSILWDLVADKKINMNSINTTLETTLALLDDIISKYRVDKTRIYATGLSQGGYMTWFMTTVYPERFAAIAPIAGGGDPEMGCKLKSVPTWIFHGALDNTIPLKEANQMVKAIEDCGGSVKLTVYPNAGHDGGVWDTAYNNPELYTWFTSNLILDGVRTDVQFSGKLTTTWGSIKQK
jgi:predicted peptidase